MFSPVEIRNPASSSTTTEPTPKAKTSGKETGSKRGRKKAAVGTGGIEEVAGSLGAGTPKSSTPGLVTRSRAAGKKKVTTKQDDSGDNDDLYATEEEGGLDGGGGDGTLEENVGGEEDMGAEDGHQQGTPLADKMIIDPVLEALQPTTNQLSPQAPGSSTSI